jgi:23S rRNA (uracil1939-C5)-methyltransferase
MNEPETEKRLPPIVEVAIERILPGGLGLAHAEGVTMFVALTAPGDIVRARIDRVRGNVAFASIEEIITPSPLRVTPPCPYFGTCGGCDFQQLNYQAQLDAKIDMIRDCLRRIAHLEEPPPIGIQAAPQQWHYRVRANWQFDQRNKALGYFEAGSHRVCDVEVCAVLAPGLQKALETIRSEIRDDAIREPPRDIRAAVGGDGGVSVAPSLAGFEPRDVSLVVAGETYSFNADSFFQTNFDLLGALVTEAIAGAKGKRAVDLYCGAGLFTVPLARRFEQVSGIETNVTSTRFALQNLQQAQLQNTKIATSDVGQWLSANAQAFKDADFLLLDPPRAGAENKVIKGILELRPQRISYVSCDPATLARDLKKLLASDYLLDSVKAFDMFPQTHHVETVVHLHCASAASR